MLGVLGFFIAVSVLHISDANLKEGPSFKNFIKNAIGLNDEAIQHLPEDVFPMADNLREANADLKQVLEKTDEQEKFDLLKSALEKETRGLSMIGVFCENPEADCKKARVKAGESTVTMTTAVKEICDAKKDVIDDIFAKTITESGSDIEFEMWAAGMQVLIEIEKGC
ncbi:hypothetical protein Q1695_004340 [Nippostrongylus brasiliensis]|nr:hypothetical protein Q1695_004340 [Nippostrongylus brasiliensis]